MNFPLRIADQLTPHLRALRKARGLTQAQLGAMVGVRQARIAELEAKPGAVSLEQLTKVLAALGSTLHLHTDDVAPDSVAPTAATEAGPKAAVAQPVDAKAATTADEVGRGGAGSHAGKPRVTRTATTATPQAAVAIRANKGIW